ncbi:MAG TPA: rhomboid family intramembrane serine protease [Gemmataceae bacterium]|nr:rhomboid family intramembrane serine protease [Gemmataceae bacterium]
MGIYDRDYYRGQGPSFMDRGQVCKWLIAINVVCFILEIVTGRPEGGRQSLFTDALVLRADAVLHGEVWRLLTYAFLHDTSSIWHIVFNMAFLWWFGSDVEDIYGAREFLALYLLTAILGGVAFVLTPELSVHRFPEASAQCLGASGAVMAVMVLCALHFPSRIILLFFFLPVPIWLFVAFEVAQDAFGLFSGNTRGTAVTVHLAGAAFAFVYYKRHWRIMGWWNEVRNFIQQWTRPRLRIYREEPRQPAPVTAPPEIDEEDQLEAKLDAVLAKVARTGQSSLTESERQILKRASEVYRRRRM